MDIGLNNTISHRINEISIDVDINAHYTLIESKILGGYTVWRAMWEGTSHEVYIVEPYGICPLHREIKLHQPVLASHTDTGFTSVFSELRDPVYVIYQHTPVKYSFYTLYYFFNHRHDIVSKAEIDLFDWYWLQPYNCFRQLLSGTSGLNVTITDDAKTVIPEILESKEITFSSPPSSNYKNDVIWLWSDILRPAAGKNGNLEQVPVQDLISVIDKLVVINNKLCITLTSSTVRILSKEEIFCF
jgi:hypothetical protein